MSYPKTAFAKFVEHLDAVEEIPVNDAAAVESNQNDIERIRSVILDSMCTVTAMAEEMSNDPELRSLEMVKIDQTLSNAMREFDLFFGTGDRST